VGQGREAAAAVPGIERVTAKTDKISKANTVELGDMQRKFQAAADEADHSHGAIVKTLTGLPEAWQGTAADAFSGYMAAFTKAAKTAREHLQAGAHGLGRAVGHLEEAKTEIEAALGHIADAYEQRLHAAQAHAQAGQPVDKQALADAAIGEYESQIDQAIGEAERAMQRIAKELHLTVHGLDSQFTVLPHAGTEVASVSHTGGVGFAHNGGAPAGGAGAAGGGGSAGGVLAGLGSSGPPPATAPPGNVKSWIDKALEILREHGIDVSKADEGYIWQIIQHESSGDPNAINLVDSNAAAGHPSKGLMQCIDSTFNAHKLPGHGDIYNPVDNIIAGVRYSISRYGSLANVPGIQAMAHGGGYVGY
jgi:uncharacterized protein YukE